MENFKPAATIHTHLVLAAVMWTVVGSTLAGVGAWWLWVATPSWSVWIGAAACTAGLVKSRFVLDRVAGRVVARIRSRGDGRCLGGFLSVRTWGLVILMMAAGRLLRHSLARGMVGTLYIAIGTALCFSSRVSWREWHKALRTG